jgi:ribosomal protein S18 acetylase RimI-like enzyme
MLRPATPDDVAFIRALAPRFADGGYPPWRDRAQLGAFSRAGLAAAIGAIGQPDQLTLIATGDDDTPLGFIHAFSEHSGLTGEEQGYISMLAVTAEAAGRGIGRALMAAAEGWARDRGYRLLTLETFGDNHAARAFYARLGYREESLKLAREL